MVLAFWAQIGGMMASRVADEREQRRGLILGLTLAEVLLLLLFLLLLAMASQLQHSRFIADTAQRRYDDLSRNLDQLKPLQEALMVGGAIDITDVQKLVLRFQQLDTIERELSKLKEENAGLVQQSELIKSLGLNAEEKLRAMAGAMRRAAEIDPNDPPALLKRAVEVLSRLGPATQPEQVRPLSQMTSDAELNQKVSNLEATSDKLRRERDNLMISGKGLSFPSCWINSTGQTEFLFDVTFMDSGVRVNDATPSRAQDAAWVMVSSFPRGSDMNERAFLAATSKLAAWSRDQKCRFYTRNHDATGQTNKDRYKYLQRQIEQSFYPFYVSSGAAPKGAPKSLPPATPGPAELRTEPESSQSQSNPLFDIFR
jgi:hypothetical protein